MHRRYTAQHRDGVVQVRGRQVSHNLTASAKVSDLADELLRCDAVECDHAFADRAAPRRRHCIQGLDELTVDACEHLERGVARQGATVLGWEPERGRVAVIVRAPGLVPNDYGSKQKSSRQHPIVWWPGTEAPSHRTLGCNENTLFLPDFGGGGYTPNRRWGPGRPRIGAGV